MISANSRLMGLMLSDTFAMLVRVMNKENIFVEEEFNHKYSLKTL